MKQQHFLSRFREIRWYDWLVLILLGILYIPVLVLWAIGEKCNKAWNWFVYGGKQ